MDIIYSISIITIVALIIYEYKDRIMKYFSQEQENGEKMVEEVKDKEIEEESDDEGDDLENEEILCTKCRKNLTEDEDHQYTCEECDNIFCDDCCVKFDNLDIIICKNCIDKLYPKQKEVVEKVIEKFIDNSPIESTKLDEDKFK